VTRGSTGAHLSKEVRYGAVGHVVATEPTSTGRCDLNLQLTWQRVDVRYTPYLNLELVCGYPIFRMLTHTLSYTVKKCARHRWHLARHHLFGAAALAAGRRTPRHGARKDQGVDDISFTVHPALLGLP
jgi:hypothetical protein